MTFGPMDRANTSGRAVVDQHGSLRGRCQRYGAGIAVVETPHGPPWRVCPFDKPELFRFQGPANRIMCVAQGIGPALGGHDVGVHIPVERDRVFRLNVTADSGGT